MKIFGTHDQDTVTQLDTCVKAEEGAIGVLCADGHKGYSMPIGGVVAYKDYISPSGVGYDIACGNMAVMTNLRASDLSQAEMNRIANEIVKVISFGIGRSNEEKVESPVIDEIAHSDITYLRDMWQKAAAQLGTVGSGNHYVDILEDENGFLWIAVHFGSRGFGHGAATGFMRLAQGHPWDSGKSEGEMMSPPILIPIKTELGQSYIEAMQLAGRYAYRGREWVVNRVLKILGAESTWEVHNHHNFAWYEEHMGEPYWVVRKGATPAFPEQHGFVGGSMGDISVILRGIDTDLARHSLFSTVHGAGRVMSRTQAAGKMAFKKAGWYCGNRECTQYFDMSFPIMGPSHWSPDRVLESGKPDCPGCGKKLHFERKKPFRKTTGLVNFEGEKAKLTERGIILRGAGADEAPPVYRPLNDVLKAHVGTIEVLNVLNPRIVVMAGAEVEDPYKD